MPTYSDAAIAAGHYGSVEMREVALEALRDRELEEVMRVEAGIRDRFRSLAEHEAYQEDAARDLALIGTRWRFLNSTVRVTNIDRTREHQFVAYIIEAAPQTLRDECGPHIGAEFAVGLRGFRRE